MAPRRSTPSSNGAPSLDAWAHKDVREVVLVSGAGTVKLRPTRLARAIVGGRVPNPLLGIAKRVEYDVANIRVADLDPDEFAAYEAFKDWLVADSMREFHPEVTEEFVRDQMPAEDREQLFSVASHVDLMLKLLGPFLDKLPSLDASVLSGANGTAAQ